MSNVLPFPSDTAIDTDELKAILFQWMEGFPLFMDGSRMFGLHDQGTNADILLAVTPQHCLEWVLTRLIVRYRGRPGVSKYEGSNLTDLSLCMTASEVSDVGALLTEVETFERDDQARKVETHRVDSLTLMDHPLGGSW